MNTAFLSGYIDTKYSETKVTSGGNGITTFQLSSPKKGRDGKRAYDYFNMEVWHDDFGTQDAVVDGSYVLVECSPRSWKTDNAKGITFTARRIWVAPAREGDTVMAAVNAARNDPSARVESYEQQALTADAYDTDIPF